MIKHGGEAIRARGNKTIHLANWCMNLFGCESFLNNAFHTTRDYVLYCMDNLICIHGIYRRENVFEIVGKYYINIVFIIDLDFISIHNRGHPITLFSTRDFLMKSIWYSCFLLEVTLILL